MRHRRLQGKLNLMNQKFMSDERINRLRILKPTNNVYDEMMKLPKKERERIHYMSPSEKRGLERSRFFTGWANAMADQWG